MMPEGLDRAEARRWFRFGCLVELSAGVLAAIIAWSAAIPWISTLAWDLSDAAWGVAATVPMLLVLWWMLHTTWKPARQITGFLDEAARPILGKWTWTELAVISLIAGVSEELLFRAVAQGGLSALLGPVWGLAIASALFGAFHLVTRAYAVFAAVMGAYLGLLWIATGNLLTPVITHALYDFVALAWLFKLRPMPERHQGA